MRYGCWALAALTALLAMFVGPTLDDYMHSAIVSQRAAGSVVSLYDFFGPSEVEWHRFQGR